jgi:hypothetical protein
VRFHGGDPTIGPRLRALLSATGLEDVREETVSNPMEKVEEKLFLAQLVGNMRASIPEAEAATAEQIDELEASVAEAARDPRPSSTRRASTRSRDGARPSFYCPVSAAADASAGSCIGAATGRRSSAASSAPVAANSAAARKAAL